MTGRATSNRVPFEVATLQRGRVAKWLEIKFAQENLDTDYYRALWGDEYERVVRQLVNDALHSGLLYRLFNGEEPHE